MWGLRLIPGEPAITASFPGEIDQCAAAAWPQPGYTRLPIDDDGFDPRRSLSVFRYRLPSPSPIDGYDVCVREGSAETMR